MNYQAKSVQKTIAVLNLSATECSKRGFKPREITKAMQTCNNTFYYAHRLGMFTKLKDGTYLPSKRLYTKEDAHQIIDLKRERQKKSSASKKQIPVQKQIVFQDAEYHINALKELGYTGTIEKKQVINF
jgi:hypothetical protein